MIAYCLYEISMEGVQGGVLIHEGEEFNVINPMYIDKNSIIYPFTTDLFNVEQLKDKFYFAYKRGKFVAIDKNRCFIPKAIGWKANV